jgi:hypothetical protein
MKAMPQVDSGAVAGGGINSDDVDTGDGDAGDCEKDLPLNRFA